MRTDMRILALNWRDPKNPEAGGAEVHLHEILTRTAALGHSVTQISQAVHGLPGEELLSGVRILRHGRRNTFNFSLRRFCEKLDIAANYDLILEDLCKIPFYSPRWSPIPVLVIVPHLFGATAYREVAFPLALYVNLMESFIPQVYGTCRFVAISESTKRDLVKRGIAAHRIVVVPCGIDTGFYARGDMQPEPQEFLYIGRLKKYKGVQFILCALALLREKGRVYRLTVLGAGDYECTLMKVAGKLGLSDVVSFEGFVPQEQKLDRLQRAWAAILPSEKEGWGLTVIEANACGTPVIASDSDGLRDSILDGETGILTPHGNIEALAAAMEKVAENPELRRRLSIQAVDWAKRFNWDDTTEKMIKIMEETRSIE